MLVGGSGNDTIVGGAGKATINGGTGKDKLYAGQGASIVQGGYGAVTLIGGGGHDTLKGGGGGNTIYGGTGDNIIPQSGDVISKANRPRRSVRSGRRWPRQRRPQTKLSGSSNPTPPPTSGGRHPDSQAGDSDSASYTDTYSHADSDPDDAFHAPGVAGLHRDQPHQGIDHPARNQRDRRPGR